MRNAIMTPKFSKLLSELLQEWSKSEYKAINYTDTYTRSALLKFLSVVQDWTMFQHCIEDREAMTQRDKHDFEDWMENAIIDKLADEDQEYRDSLDKPPRNGN
jgi:arsenate reductase-like glutaredoxin family protein